MKKLIKKDYFNAIANAISEMDDVEVLAVVKEQNITPEMALDFIEKEIALLDKKNSSVSKKLTPNQEANIRIKEIILEEMEPKKGYTCTDMMAFEEIAIMEPKVTNQRISALVKQMLDETEDASDASLPLIKKVEKRKSYFYKKQKSFKKGVGKPTPTQ